MTQQAYTGPFIVTTKRGDHPVMWTTVESVAVATLEEARETAHTIVAESATAASLAVTTTAGWAPHDDDAIALPESGGTVGPLPDGTLIEVGISSWEWLATDAGLSETVLGHMAACGDVEARAKILAAHKEANHA